jgi:hypothetical protein
MVGSESVIRHIRREEMLENEARKRAAVGDDEIYYLM